MTPNVTVYCPLCGHTQTPGQTWSTCDDCLRPCTLCGGKTYIQATIYLNPPPVPLDPPDAKPVFILDPEAHVPGSTADGDA